MSAAGSGVEALVVKIASRRVEAISKSAERPRKLGSKAFQALAASAASRRLARAKFQFQDRTAFHLGIKPLINKEKGRKIGLQKDGTGFVTTDHSAGDLGCGQAV